MKPAALMLLPVLAAGAAAPALADPALYTLTKSVAIGAPQKTDYLTWDATDRRVYIAHGDRVTVLSRDGEHIGEVTGFAGGTHGIAISHATGKGYTDDGEAGEVGAFALKTFAPGKRIQTADDADGLALDPASGHVFVSNGDSGILSVIDPATDTRIANIAGLGKLEFLVASGNGKVYVNGAQQREILRVDTHANAVDAHWPIPACASPHGLAIDRETHRLFASCVNQLMVIVNADSGAIVATLPIGAGTDSAAFDPTHRRAFSANGKDGTLSIIEEKDADTFVALPPVPTAAGARNLTVDPETGRLYLVTGGATPTLLILDPTK